MKNQKTDSTQPSVRITMPWPWLTFKAPRTMQSTPQIGPTMAAILIDLRAPRGAAGNEDLLPVMPFSSTGKTVLLFSSVHPHASNSLPALVAFKPSADPTLPAAWLPQRDKWNSRWSRAAGHPLTGIRHLGGGRPSERLVAAALARLGRRPLDVDERLIQLFVAGAVPAPRLRQWTIRLFRGNVDGSAVFDRIR
jgi:hypothetical protein